MNDLRAVSRVTDNVGGNLQDMVIAANCEPREYYAQATDPYLKNRPIRKGYFNETKIAFFTKWYNIITRKGWFYNEVNDTDESGWYDENGVKNE